MPLDHLATAHGAPAREVICGLVQAAKANDPLAPVTVIVGSRVEGDALLRWLARRTGGLAAVRARTLGGVARELSRGRLTQAGERPLSPVVTHALASAALASQRGSLEAAAHPRTAEALAGQHATLSVLPAATIDRLTQSSPTLAALASAHVDMRASLQGRWHDRARRLQVAIDAIRGGDSDHLGSVVVQADPAWLGGELDLVRALAEQSTVTVVSRFTGDTEADAAMHRLHRELGLPPTTPPEVQPVRPSRVRLLHQPADEVRSAVDTLCSGAESGIPLHRMAVAHCATDPYARMLQEGCVAAGLEPVGGPQPLLQDTPPGAALLALVGLGAEPTPDIPPSTVLRLLTTAPVPHPDDPAAISRLIRCARAATAGGAWPPADTDLVRLLAYIRTFAGEGQFPSHWPALVQHLHTALRWSNFEQPSIEAVESAVTHLADLDGLIPLDAASALEALSKVLQAPAASPRSTGGVRIGPLGDMVGLDLQLLVVIGATDDHLPGTIARGLIPVRSTDEQRQIIHTRCLAALASASSAGAGRIVLGSRYAHNARHPRVLSRWIHDPKMAPASEARVPQPISGGDARLLAITAAGCATTPDRALSRAIECEMARRSGRFTRFDGNLGDPAARAVALPAHHETGTSFSPTELEAFATCPHHWFLRTVLGVATERPRATEPDHVDPLALGSLLHDVLRQVIQQGIATDPDHSRAVARAVALLDRAARRPLACGRLGHQRVWALARRGLTVDLEAFIVAERERHDTGVVSSLVEAAFGGESEWPALPVVLPDGRVLQLHGRIDRVDRLADGSIAVIDYKTGSARGAASLTTDRPLGDGTKFQLIAYALAARAMHQNPSAPTSAGYWFVTAKGDHRRTQIDVTPRAVEQFRSAVGTIVDGIEHGHFPARPASTDPIGFVLCPACDPDGLGTSEIRRRWEALRTDPLLRSYTQLVEPDAVTTDVETGRRPLVAVQARPASREPASGDANHG